MHNCIVNFFSGKPFATNWSPDTIDLEWEPPKNDGGSTITKWIIEKKTKFGIWEVACEAPGPRPVGSVSGLTEGTEYEFRIIAVNEAGPSEPSEPSDPITAEARYVQPWIDTSALQDMVVCAGQCISYHVPIQVKIMGKSHIFFLLFFKTTFSRYFSLAA